MIINCPECYKEVSDSAKFCPNCGYPIKEAKESQPPNIIIKKEEGLFMKSLNAGCMIIIVIIVIAFTLSFGTTIFYRIKHAFEPKEQQIEQSK